MMHRFFIWLQHCTPQHLLTAFIGWLASIRSPWFKNHFIRFFIKWYKVDMSVAIQENPEDYPTFNHFFIRKLKSHLRPIAPGLNEIASPVDGFIAQLGHINKLQLTQAKDMYFTLESLLGDSQLAERFHDGDFITLYLAPKDYHRIHMPIDGILKKTIYIPGNLFSVNTITSRLVPNLYARNERIITIFETQAGTMAVVLIGAMIVGSIQTVWMPAPIKQAQKQILACPEDFHLKKGDELGYFKLGSTVILLFTPNHIQWSSFLKTESTIQYGQSIGHF